MKICPTCHQPIVNKPIVNNSQANQIREYYLQLSYNKKLTKTEKYDKIEKKMKIPRPSIRRVINSMVSKN